MIKTFLFLMMLLPVVVFPQPGDSIYFIPQIKPDSSLYLADGITFEIISPQKTKRERVRLTAAILCITLGPFGVHRLYLGTETSVPVFYTLTLGGGLGILPVVDLFLIAFSKDLERYKNNPNVFMWSERPE